MDISIQAHHNLEIPLEISHFDTVADIKQKIQSLTGISAPRQTLYFSNALLPDSADVARCNLLDHSRVRLLIRTPTLSESPPPQILVRNPISKRHVAVEIGADTDSFVSELKQSISKRERVSPELFSLFLFGRELDENLKIIEVEGLKRDDAVVEMVLAFGGTRNNAASLTTAKVVVAVVPKNVKVKVTVTLSHCFGDLRRELEKLRKENKVELPENWIFVYRREKVMMEYTASFESLKVVDGDVVQVYPSLLV